MKISALITLLEAAKNVHGDMQVYFIEDHICKARDILITRIKAEYADEALIILPERMPEDCPLCQQNLSMGYAGPCQQCQKEGAQ